MVCKRQPVPRDKRAYLLRYFLQSRKSGIGLQKGLQRSDWTEVLDPLRTIFHKDNVIERLNLTRDEWTGYVIELNTYMVFDYISPFLR